MSNSIEAFVNEKGSYEVKVNGNIDEKIYSSFVTAFVEHQSKVEIEKQKTLQEKEKRASAGVWMIALSIIPMVIGFIACSYFEVKKQEIQLEAKKLESSQSIKNAETNKTK